MTHSGPTARGVTSPSARRARAIRRALGLTQRDYAYLLRVAVNTVSAWETGKAHPSPLADAAIRHLAANEGLDLHRMRSFWAT